MSGAETIAGAEADAAQPVATMRGLLWWEWLANGGLISAFTALWLIAAVVLELFFHPGFMLAFGVLYALVVGTASGGGEAFAGVEEFIFALPPTRSERYLARLVLGGGALVALQVAGLAAIALDLPQLLWGLVVDSGFTEPFAGASPTWYWLAAAVPFAVFAVSFACAAGGKGAAAWPAGLLSLMITGLVVAIGCIVEGMLWGAADGRVSCPSLFALTASALLLGHRSYVRKEGIARLPAVGGGARWWLLWLVVLVVLAALLLAVARKTAVEGEIERAEHERPAGSDRMSP